MRACILFAFVALIATLAHAAVPPTSSVRQTNQRGARTVRVNGYTLDVCKDDDGCKAPRHCILGKCLADSEDGRECKSCSDCAAYAVDKHEVCATDEQGGKHCMSTTHALEFRLEVASDCAVDSTATAPKPKEPEGIPRAPFPSVLPMESGSGKEGPTQPPITTTATQPRDEEDGDGESSSNSEGSSSVCIAEHHLGHLAAHELVFDAHVRATVLCDAMGSCATPGHMVVFRRRAMMMRSYCAVAHGGCTARQALVNSPRFRRKVAVPSSTDGLHFTALAARFETKVEEQALKLAVLAGM